MYLHLGGRSPPTGGTASSANSNRRTANPTRLSRTWSPCRRSRAGADCRPSRTRSRAAPAPGSQQYGSRCTAPEARFVRQTQPTPPDAPIIPPLTAACADGPSRTHRQPAIDRLRTTQDDNLLRTFAYLVFCGLYKDMFRRGVQDRITHVVTRDEAHGASRLKPIPTMAKGCRKPGVSLVLACQQAKDADTSVISGIAKYLVLRSTDADARFPVKYIFDSFLEKILIDIVNEMNVFGPLYIRKEKGDKVKFICYLSRVSNDGSITRKCRELCEIYSSFAARTCVSESSTGVSR